MKNIITLLVSVAGLSMFIACSNAPKGEQAVTEAAKKVAAPMAAKSYAVDGSLSKVSWTGSKVGGKHTGTIDVNTGSVQVKDGKVVGGSFNLDINSPNVTDLEAGKGKEKLEGHLKAPDFFDAANNPNATFTISNVANGTVTGNLTLNGTTKSISFPAKIDVSDSGVMVTTPDFTINRTDFGMKYGSATFIDGLKDKAINDNVGLSISLKAS